jgi:hypothetical protein
VPRSALLTATAIATLAFVPPTSASDQAITEALGRSVQQCWAPPPGAAGAAVIQMLIAPDGSLTGERVANDRGGATDALAASALRAVRACAPYPAVGRLIGKEAVEIRASFSLAGFSAVTSAAKEAGPVPAVTIAATDDITLAMPQPTGLCYVDPAGGGLQSEYVKLMSGTLPGNRALAFFLDCETVRQLAAGIEDFTLPKRSVTLSAPLSQEGGSGLQRFPKRSQAQAIEFYEGFFRREGAPGSALDRKTREVEDGLREAFDIAVKGDRQLVVGSDERAAYTAMTSTAETDEGTFRQMSIAAYSQVFDLPITLSLYAPFDEGGTDALLEEAQSLIAALHADSKQSD